MCRYFPIHSAPDRQITASPYSSARCQIAPLGSPEGKIGISYLGGFAHPSPTPTTATPTPTTAIERRRWRKRLRCPYIRSRNLKSESLCKNKRMNFGATIKQHPSTPGLYREKSPTTSASSCSRSKAIYVRPEFHQRIQRIVRLLDNDKISMYSYLDRVLEHHFATFDEEITAWCRNRFQALARDLKTTLPWE